MADLTLSEIRERLENHFHEDVQDSGMWCWEEMEGSDIVEVVDGLGDVRVEHLNTGDGDGAEMQIVFRITTLKDEVEYYHITGNWHSYGNGADWHGDLARVYPESRSIVFFEERE